MQEKRKKEIKIRVTESEYEALLSRKDGALAVWMRQVCLGEQIRTAVKPPEIDPKFLYQLAAIGNNVNQIAKNLNRGKWGAADKILVYEALLRVERSLNALRENHAG